MYELYGIIDNNGYFVVACYARQQYDILISLSMHDREIFVWRNVYDKR